VCCRDDEPSAPGLLAVLDRLEDRYARQERRACGFLNAVAELTAPAPGALVDALAAARRLLDSVGRAA